MELSPRGVSESEHMNVSSTRKVEHQNHPHDIPFEWVDDEEWDAIERAFNVPSKPRVEHEDSARAIGSSAAAEAAAPSMVPSIAPSPTAARHRFGPASSYPSPLAIVSHQVRVPEGLKQQRDFQCGALIGHNPSGDGAARRAVGLPCQFATRNDSPGGGKLSRMQSASECPEAPSSDSTSAADERRESDAAPLQSNSLPGAVHPDMASPEAMTEVLALNPEEGGGGSARKRRLPAWMEPAKRFLFPAGNSIPAEEARDVSGGGEGVPNSETVEEEQARRPNAEQLGDGVAAPQQAENGATVWYQVEQPRIGLQWGLQPASRVDVVKPRFPLMQFRGQIVYSKTELEVNAATTELWRRVHELQLTSPDGAIPIGFDLEWRPNLDKGEIPGKVAVLQLCLDDRRCDVMQIVYSGIPLSLQELLETPSTLKVGIGIFGDISRLRQDYQITTRKIADLRVIANRKMNNLKQWGLSSLALELTGKQVDKNKSIRCGDWEALPLSEPQLLYAATDAFASLYIYQVLQSLPDPVKESSRSRDDSKSPTDAATS